MSQSTIAIVGSGIAATALAYRLTARGYDVAMFEKGPEYPYPFQQQFYEQRNGYTNPTYQLSKDLDHISSTGDYTWEPVANGRVMVVGGSASVWAGIALRMRPTDFRTKTLFGYGDDWPVTYDELEPYYCQAESLLGVSGTDSDNPFAPPRSQPYPLPPFDLSYDDQVLAERLQAHGIAMHTTPQARARLAYDGRPGCQNFGTCRVCPLGVRYSPHHHLQKALGTGLLTLRPNVSVRRVVTDATGRARSVVIRPNDGGREEEHHARVIIVAAGAIETARLLLLSESSHEPNGVGNNSGHVGAHLVFHHQWPAELHFEEKLLPGRLGAWTGQSHQFLDGPHRARHGSMQIELASRSPIEWFQVPPEAKDATDVLERMRKRVEWRPISFIGESQPSDQKHVTLSAERDRYGDPFAHVHYHSSDFDFATYELASTVFSKVAEASGCDDSKLWPAQDYGSAHHHMGTCRMGSDARDSVVDSFGRVHGSPNLYLAGSSIFRGPSGAINPTLSIVALALRTADFVLDQQV
jgi:glucose dehydrogenase